MPLQIYKIASTTVTASAGQSSIDFQNIPGGYTDLLLVLSGRTTNAGTTDTVTMEFNGLTTNQTSRRLRGTGSAADSASYSRFYFVVDGNTATSSVFASTQIYIPNYSGSTNKSFSIETVMEDNATAANSELWAGLWSSTAAITRVTVSGQSTNFVTNSKATLYGVL